MKGQNLFLFKKKKKKNRVENDLHQRADIFLGKMRKKKVVSFSSAEFAQRVHKFR